MNGTPPPQDRRIYARGYLAVIRSGLTRTKFNFPSHLRILGFFRQHSPRKFCRGTTKYHPEFAERFPPGSASVAIV